MPFPTVHSSSASLDTNNVLESRSFTPAEPGNGSNLDEQHLPSCNLGDDDSGQTRKTVDLGRGDSRFTEEVLASKLQWATRKLATVESVEESTQLCLLIKTCAEALKSVRELDARPHMSTYSYSASIAR